MCSYVGFINIYNCYIFFLDWSLDLYVVSFFRHMPLYIQSGVWLLPSRGTVQVTVLFYLRAVPLGKRVPVYLTSMCDRTRARWCHTWPLHVTLNHREAWTSKRQVRIFWVAQCLHSKVLARSLHLDASISSARLKAPSEWWHFCLHVWHLMDGTEILLN